MFSCLSANPILPETSVSATIVSMMEVLLRRVHEVVAENSELKADVLVLQFELDRRKFVFRIKANTSTRTNAAKDRCKAHERKHPG